MADGTNINRELIHQGYAVFRSDLGGAEQQAMHGRLGRWLGEYSEELFFQGDQSRLNPMRYLPTPFHTKYAQQRTALAQYIEQESVGTRMRRWERPIHDMLANWFRGTVERTTGIDIIPEGVQRRRDLDTLADMLEFLRAEVEADGQAQNTWSRSAPRQVATIAIRSRAAHRSFRQHVCIYRHRGVSTTCLRGRYLVSCCALSRTL